MPQLFPPFANTLAKVALVGVALLAGGALTVLYLVDQSPYSTNALVVHNQPVPFSHEHHARGLGIDCRVCHATVEKSSFAGMPATKVCMACHSQIWRDAPMLKPVRDSWATNTPLVWKRVHNLPDYVYFNHSIHVAKGVGCQSCHGPVNQMPLMWQNATLLMNWCLDCHRQPEQFVRPSSEITNIDWVAPATQLEKEGPALVKQYGIKKEQLTNCSMCHR